LVILLTVANLGGDTMKLNNKDLDTLWIEYTKTKSKKIKNKLIEAYYPFVKKIAAKLAEKLNYKVTIDDLTSSGIDGLYRAIERYKLGRGVKFESYAQLRIRGSMIDWLRKDDIIPRSVRMHYNKFERTRQEMQRDLGCKLTDDEIAEKLDISDEFVRNKKKFHPVMFCSLDNSNYNNDEVVKGDVNVNLIDQSAKNPEGRLRRIEFFNKLMGRNFNRTERMIVYLYYYKHYTMDKVAKQVGLSESRVSQMHKQILPRLRERVERNPEYFGKDIHSYVCNLQDKESVFE
jgi:RNA polymerase sigma factor for flagellar operon FliA|tara:strand:+ start:7538 stop:8404 length:867 start_codon:yes stop_codon:yes gene_type:complete